MSRVCEGCQSLVCYLVEAVLEAGRGAPLGIVGPWRAEPLAKRGAVRRVVGIRDVSQRVRVRQLSAQDRLVGLAVAGLERIALVSSGSEWVAGCVSVNSRARLDGVYDLLTRSTSTLGRSSASASTRRALSTPQKRPGLVLRRQRYPNQVDSTAPPKRLYSPTPSLEDSIRIDLE